MKIKLTRLLTVGMVLLTVFSIPAGVAAQSVASRVSANIPLDSYIYTDLAKLDGLGYLKEMPNGAKPYTRMQVARWLTAIREQVLLDQRVPTYAQALLNRLEAEFNSELALLAGKTAAANGLAFQELKVAGSYYHGETLNQVTKSAYQPLNINNNGFKLEDGWNGLVSGRVAGAFGNYLLVSLTPRFDLNEEDDPVSLESGYFKTHYRNLQIQLGKDALWWGPGERGNLGLTNNARPLTSIQLSNLEPIRPDGIFKMLQQLDIHAFYADLEENRGAKDGAKDVDSPGFGGVRIAAAPGANFTVAGTLTAIVGGVGHELHLSDLGDFITGKNAETATGDKWDTIAGFDFRWRIPQLNGLQLYGELYGEDQAGKIIPLPSKNAYLVGFDLPRLSADGQWDLKFETAQTTNVWYTHSLYRNGYTYHNNLIGDAMGYNARRYYVKLSRYLPAGAWLALRAERLTMDQDAANPPQVTTIWLSYNMNLQADLTLTVTTGVARVENLNNQAERSVRNYLGSVGLTKRF
jgi:hypothetical protein